MAFFAASEQQNWDCVKLGMSFIFFFSLFFPTPLPKEQDLSACADGVRCRCQDQPVHARLAKREVYGVRAAGNYERCFQVYCPHRVVLPRALLCSELTVLFLSTLVVTFSPLSGSLRGREEEETKPKAFDEEGFAKEPKALRGPVWGGDSSWALSS